MEIIGVPLEIALVMPDGMLAVLDRNSLYHSCKRNFVETVIVKEGPRRI